MYLQESEHEPSPSKVSSILDKEKCPVNTKCMHVIEFDSAGNKPCKYLLGLTRDYIHLNAMNPLRSKGTPILLY